MALQDPPPNIQAHPAPNNLLEWHYALEGGKGTEYEGGVYHGKITFPADYPYKPPSIVMLTASGRFAVNTKLCLSMTNFHPGIHAEKQQSHSTQLWLHLHGKCCTSCSLRWLWLTCLTGCLAVTQRLMLFFPGSSQL